MNEQYYTERFQTKQKMSVLRCLRRLPNDICKKIMKEIFPKSECCRCTKHYICTLCLYGCCERAMSKKCVCIQCIYCPIHGQQCHGSHD